MNKTTERVLIVCATLCIMLIVVAFCAVNSINAAKDKEIRQAKVAACETIKDDGALTACLLSVDGVND